ncbi:MAG: YaiO family outer membrane beta-barrel protein [Bacteroidota bacterium]
MRTAFYIALALFVHAGWPTAPAVAQPSVTVRAVGDAAHMTSSLGSWHGQQVSVQHTLSDRVSWNLNLAHYNRFDAKGEAQTLQVHYSADAGWTLGGAFQSSSRGFFLPERTLEVSARYAMSPVLLDVGVARLRARDEHRDVRLHAGTAWYTPIPTLVVQTGVYATHSMPGTVLAVQGYGVIQYGAVGQYHIVARYQQGDEAYQLLGDEALLVRFPSRSLSATWQGWIQPTWGVSLGMTHYRNPFYQRTGATAGVFVQWP